MEKRQRELRETFDAGEEALRHVIGAIVRLEDAETYGTWDLFGGSGLLHRQKYLRLNEARRHIQQAEACLGRCEDLAGCLPGSGQWVLDVIFDNPVTDKRVLDQIRQSRRKLTQVQEQIEKRQLRLMEELARLEDESPEA